MWIMVSAGMSKVGVGLKYYLLSIRGCPLTAVNARPPAKLPKKNQMSTKILLGNGTMYTASIKFLPVGGSGSWFLYKSYLVGFKLDLLHERFSNQD